jgi:plastocyanin
VATTLALCVTAGTPSAHAGGKVAGTVSVEQAAIRTEGAKHDRDVVLSLSRKDGRSFPPAAARATMDQRGLVFIPHVLAIQTGTTVAFLNNDHDQHNVYFLDDETGETLDIGTWGYGSSVDHTFDRPGTVITLCKLHLEMAAYIVVMDGPYFTTVQLDADNRQAAFEIPDVPPGDYLLTAWHKKLKQKGGQAEVTVTEGATTMADVVVTKARYARVQR